MPLLVYIFFLSAFILYKFEMYVTQVW